jgi:ketosteroid isomerase-like protein
MTMGAEHANVGKIREALATYNAGDRDAMREFLAPDIRWHVSGDHPLSGDYEGVDEVLAYIDRVQELTEGSLRIEPTQMLADDSRASVFMRVTATRADRKLEVEMAETLLLDEQGRWTEYWALADDQAAVDAFWS